MRAIFIFLMTFWIYNASAQYNGVDRRIGRNPVPIGKKKQPEKIDFVAEGVKRLSVDLDLDAFQQAVVTDLMEKNQSEETKVHEMDIPDEGKIQRIVALRDKLNDDIIKILNPTQVEKFEKLREKQSKKKKKKK